MGMPGPKKINRYGLDFKLRAVRMSGERLAIPPCLTSIGA